MRSSLLRVLAVALAAVPVFSFVPLLLAQSPLTGTWKITALPGADELALWLVRLEEKAGKPQATLLSAGSPDLKNYSVEVKRLDAGAVELTLKSNVNNQRYSVVGYAPKGDAKAKRLFGSLGFQGGRDLAWLDRSELKELPAGKTAVRGAAAEAFHNAGQPADAKKPDVVDPKKLTADLSAVVQKHATHPAAILAAFELVRVGVETQEAEAELRRRAEQTLKLVNPYGREVELQFARQIAQTLREGPPSHKAYLAKVAPVMHDYAARAYKLLQADDPPDAQAAVLKTLSGSLKRAGKTDEAKEIHDRLAKLEEALDREYLKTSIPFKVEPFAGRKQGTRVALLELFTGAQCPPCVPADVAFDALAKTYKPTELVLLQYHLHVPDHDPLTNGDSDKRSDFYDVEGTPAAFLNGEKVKGPEGQGIGGFPEHAEGRYHYLKKEIDRRLAAEAPAGLKVNAERKGTRVEATVEISGLKQTGESIRLHVALVESSVRYLGSNGQRLHHQVVRSLPRGQEGIPLKQAAVKERIALDLGQLRKSLEDYLNKFPGVFPEDDRPLNLTGLKIVAFIQDQRTKEVLHAVQAEVP